MRSAGLVCSATIAVAVAVAPATASDNLANDYLLSISPAAQARMLGKVAGDGCVGTLAFYQGSVGDRPPRADDAPIMVGHEHDAIWNVKCTNGKSYVIGVFPTGGSNVLACSVLKTIHAGQCFVKYK